jgi:hypothetical protein
VADKWAIAPNDPSGRNTEIFHKLGFGEPIKFACGELLLGLALEDRKVETSLYEHLLDFRETHVARVGDGVLQLHRYPVALRMFRERSNYLETSVILNAVKDLEILRFAQNDMVFDPQKRRQGTQ